MLFENENSNEGMQAVLNELHTYVPYPDIKKHTTVSGVDEQGMATTHNVIEKQKRFSAQGIVGDQLSVERGVNSLMQIANGLTPDDRKDGIHFEVKDFHAQMKFLQVIQSKIVFNPLSGNRLFFYLLNDLIENFACQAKKLCSLTSERLCNVWKINDYSFDSFISIFMHCYQSSHPMNSCIKMETTSNVSSQCFFDLVPSFFLLITGGI